MRDFLVDEHTFMRDFYDYPYTFMRDFLLCYVPIVAVPQSGHKK